MFIHSPTTRKTIRPNAYAPEKDRSAKLDMVVVPKKGATEKNGRSETKQNNHKKTPLWSPWKLMLFALVFGLMGMLYLTHVFQTQEQLREVQLLRMEHERAMRIHTNARREYDRMMGPSEVYRRAESLGMIHGGATDPVITR
ncbi:hypothetical protein QLX67_05305 [Balneolaceae bacterium ANBcel3]|nr:hypothetical protein [Balneolaceae bacterium ANBcel3]